MKERNYALDFLKFLFAVIILLFHSVSLPGSETMPIFVNGRIGVEFFFLVSGCLMCASAMKTPAPENLGEDTLRFMKRKIAVLMPNYFVAYAIAFAVFHWNSGSFAPRTLLVHAVQSLPDLLLIKNSGIRAISYNGVTWYLSAMLLCMLVLYPLARKYRDVFLCIIAPSAFLFIMGNLFQRYGELSTLEYWEGHFMKGTVRAAGDLLGGCLCYKAACSLRRYSFTSLGKLLLTLAEWGCYGVSILYIYGHPASRYDYLILLLFMVGVTITYANVSWDKAIFRHRIFGWLGQYSLSLYLGHSCWRKYTANLFPAAWGFEPRLWAYIGLSLLTGLFILYVSLWLRRLWKRWGPSLRKMVIQ